MCSKGSQTILMWTVRTVIGQMPRLIRVIAGCTGHFVTFIMRLFIYAQLSGYSSREMGFFMSKKEYVYFENKKKSKRLDYEVSICSLIPPAMAISDNMVSVLWHLVTPCEEKWLLSHNTTIPSCHWYQTSLTHNKKY